MVEMIHRRFEENQEKQAKLTEDGEVFLYAKRVKMSGISLKFKFEIKVRISSSSDLNF